ncbi:flagellar assembly protein FliH [Shewanella halifaxensis]|uniref:flagellar assembly protein FliH n=1 Tax=Shewanella halifaxensis TaxID=271098 RepID=UPI000D5A18D6|nr:flagellar assembly protein FliH [Shewanella halifaxensis]
MTEPKKPQGASLISEDEFGHWELPDISQELDPQSLNMFGRNSLQLAEDEVAEAETILPPTLSEIEDIRAHAEQEGFTEGQERGFNEGLEKGRLQGLEEGHTEGFAQGQQQGFDAGLQAATEMVSRFEQLIAQFEAPLAILDTEIEKELLATSMTLAKVVIGHELKTYPEHILAALRQGVDSLPIKQQKVNLRLAPSDQELVTELYSQAQLERNGWEIEIDPSLTPGDCIIDSGRSHIDMTVETRMQHVFNELDKHQQDLTQLKEQQQQALLAAREQKVAEATKTDATQNNAPNLSDNSQSSDQDAALTSNEGEHDNTVAPTAQ